MSDWKIGEIIGDLKCEEKEGCKGEGEEGCKGCHFENRCYLASLSIRGACQAKFRVDKKDVFFVKVEE